MESLSPERTSYRIACSEPCELDAPNANRQGTVWNVSTRGAYVALESPLPSVGDTMRISFELAGESKPVSCYARVVWHNPASIFKGCGSVAARLPPGCGLQFLNLDPTDWNRIVARATLRSSLR
jgi:hypothetical protein